VRDSGRHSSRSFITIYIYREKERKNEAKKKQREYRYIIHKAALFFSWSVGRKEGRKKKLLLITQKCGFDRDDRKETEGSRD